MQEQTYKYPAIPYNPRNRRVLEKLHNGESIESELAFLPDSVIAEIERHYQISLKPVSDKGVLKFFNIIKGFIFRNPLFIRKKYRLIKNNNG